MNAGCSVFGAHIDPKTFRTVSSILESSSVSSVYTERGENNIRIISARRATPKEEKLYYENYDIR